MLRIGVPNPESMIVGMIKKNAAIIACCCVFETAVRAPLLLTSVVRGCDSGDLFHVPGGPSPWVRSALQEHR